MLENGLEDSLTFYAFPKLDARKISSSNMIERLNREIRRRTSVVGIFPNEASYVRLVTTYLMEYAVDWSVSRAYLSQDSIEATLLHCSLIPFFRSPFCEHPLTQSFVILTKYVVM